MQNEHQIQLFFAPLRNRNITCRKQFLEELKNVFDTDSCVCNGNNNHNELCNYLEDHTEYYPIILRLAYTCPFKDVRESCEYILSTLEKDGVRIPRRKYVGPSRFILDKDCTPINTDDEEVHSLFVEAFLVSGRTSHINQLLGYHGKYLSWFLQFESHLMRSNGPLPLDWRHYIGIMGTSRHQCGALIEACESGFLIYQGDPNWLNGLEHIPVKLRKLNKINKLLAHQPWRVTVEVLKELLVGPAAETWSVSELIQAIVILVHFHTLSGFVYGCGINPEVDSRKGHSRRSLSGCDGSSGAEVLTPTKVKAGVKEFKMSTEEGPGTTAVLFQKIQKVQMEEEQRSQEEEEEDEKLRQFQEVETKDLNESDHLVSTDIFDSKYEKYLDDMSFHYEEFAKRENRKIDVFRAQDYSWQEHGFSFINRLYPEIGTLLEAKFQCTYNLTYNTMGDHIKDVDTSKFRLATWNYIHLIYGIYHDDYVYYEVNKLLEKPYKSYIKKVSCFPERVNFIDYRDCYTDLLPSEKVHINLLVLESRLQAALLYASRGITTYLK